MAGSRELMYVESTESVMVEVVISVDKYYNPYPKGSGLYKHGYVHITDTKLDGKRERLFDNLPYFVECTFDEFIADEMEDYDAQERWDIYNIVKRGIEDFKKNNLF